MMNTEQTDYAGLIDAIGPARLELARIPTPLEPMERLSESLGVELFIKRDDLTGSGLSGNKIRKLEYVLAEALNREADIVLTCGGAQSNHARATAVAAARLGIKSLLLLRTPDPKNPPPLEANSLLDRLVGAEILWVSPEEYANRDEVFKREAERLSQGGSIPYIIPEGASNALGSWGYIRTMSELALDLKALNRKGPVKTTVVYAAGSGGTGAGLILGRKLFNLDVRVAGVNVAADREYFVRAIDDICQEAIQRFDLGVEVAESDIEIIDGYVGRGYALSRPEELKLIREVARRQGIILDPVYTGKAFYGMVQELSRNPEYFGERVVFIHTGGIYGLFPKAVEMEEVL